MLKKYKNGFIEFIVKHGFHPSEFERHEEALAGHPAFILRLKNSPMFFTVRTNSDDYHELFSYFIMFSPNYSQSECHPPKNWTNIYNIYVVFEHWLEDHVKPYLEEIEVPDMWEQIEGNHLFDIDPLANKKIDFFDELEKDKLKSAISYFQKAVEAEFKPTVKQLTAIDDRLKYLSESSGRLNKVDWQSLAISTLISISIALSLDTENGKSLFQLFKNTFASASTLING